MENGTRKKVRFSVCRDLKFTSVLKPNLGSQHICSSVLLLVCRGCVMLAGVADRGAHRFVFRSGVQKEWRSARIAIDPPCPRLASLQSRAIICNRLIASMSSSCRMTNAQDKRCPCSKSATDCHEPRWTLPHLYGIMERVDA